MPDRPQMFRVYISDARLGDGYRTAFILTAKGETATLYVTANLATVTIDRRALTKATPISYRPRVVRTNLLNRARLYRKYGYRFPRTATVQLLRMLGAGQGAIHETVNAPALPEVIAARVQRMAHAERLERLADIQSAIRAKIEAQPRTRPTLVPRTRKSRVRFVHPDQFALGL